MSYKKIRTIKIIFGQELTQTELPLFRGAVIASMEKASLLFHNHTEYGLRYAYPLVQYKIINKKAAIICVGDGVDAIGEFFSSGNFLFDLGKRQVQFYVDDVKVSETNVQIWNEKFTYRINRWLALNQENNELYNSIDSLAERYEMLDRILTGNILSFAKSMGITFEQMVECHIVELDGPHKCYYKGVPMHSFSGVFKCNVSLPYYIGLGKGVSLGHGVISKFTKEK